MKVLWLTNVIPNCISDVLDEHRENGGGWIEQLAILMDKNEEIRFVLCANYQSGDRITKREWGNGSVFYGYKKRFLDPVIYDSSLETVFKEIIDAEKPDLVHIYGTEYPHTLAMVRAFNRSDKTIVNIQGLVSVYYKHYSAYLPNHVVNGWTFRDLIRRDNIKHQADKFEKRGIYEIEALKHVKHVVGRTEWDKACLKTINPDVEYHYLQEAMREPFYSGKWDVTKCERHSLFMSQGSYPIKGLHLALEAVYFLRQKYNDVKLYVAGPDLHEKKDFRKRIRMGSYQKYVIKLIHEKHLENNVVFTGNLTAEQMKERYLKCNCFLSASSIENSPNSVGEALCLGVPVVASMAGGTGSLFDHGKEGFLYQADAPYMAAHFIRMLFDNDEVASQMGGRAYERAKKQYELDYIINELIDIYTNLKQIP